MAIGNNMHIDGLGAGAYMKAPEDLLRDALPKTAVQDANSSEEKAIAASTTLNREISKGDKKSAVEDASVLKRIKLIEKINSLEKLNLTEAQVSEKAAQLKGQIQSGQNLIKYLLDSQGGESMLQYAALKRLEGSEDPNGDVGSKVAKYVELLEVHKNKTITSWVNTSATVAASVPDKEMAFQIQSMLSASSEKTLTVRQLLGSVIRIGGEDRSNEVQQFSIEALAADIRSETASNDLGTLIKTLGNLSNMESVQSMYKVANEQLTKLFNKDILPSISNTDFLEISLDISTSLDKTAIKSYSIAVLDASPQSGYQFCESMLQTFASYPQNVWNDSNEKQAAIKAVSSVMYNFSDSGKYDEAKARSLFSL